MRSDRREELAPSGSRRVGYEAGVHVAVRFSMVYKYDAVVASNTEVAFWERSKATAQRSLRSGLRIDRGSGAEKTRDFKNAAITVLATVAAAP